MNGPACRGRFAPTPSGPLHFGSLVAAVASFADARHQRGDWLVRIEDVDQTRSRPGADRDILGTLLAFGMQWDGEPVWQSRRAELYGQALDRLRTAAAAYPCNCSRKLIAAMARPGTEGPVYPGTCRQEPPDQAGPCAWRVIVGRHSIGFEDRVYGEVAQDLAEEIGDFIIRRVDGFTAYQLAVVVDDQAQGITDVVRGADLLWSTPRQIHLQQLLGFATPRYAHLPLVYGSNGHKLSKRDRAHPVDPLCPMTSLRAAWRHLGQVSPPAGIDEPRAFWAWATARWAIERVPADQADRDRRADPA